MPREEGRPNHLWRPEERRLCPGRWLAWRSQARAGRKRLGRHEVLVELRASYEATSCSNFLSSLLCWSDAFVENRTDHYPDHLPWSARRCAEVEGMSVLIGEKMA